MSAFIRRFSSFPGVDVITQIEGVIIVDNPPPGSISGVGSGTVAMVGEFTDMKYAVSIDTAGAVTSKPQPVEIFSGGDLVAKVGSFDETIGEFGKAGGNGYAQLRNKRFARLVLVPINLASAKAVRLFRVLPTNLGSNLAGANPVVPMTGATVPAGLEFKTGTSRVRVATAFTFTGDDAYKTGADGSTTAAAAAATQTFTSGGSDFVAAGVIKGDVLVLGMIADGTYGANADTYRVSVVAPGSDVTKLTMEKLDGSNFAFTTLANQPWRLHVAATADSGANTSASQTGGYTLPARPLDATITMGTSLAATTAAPAAGKTSWDPLSGLHLLVQAASDLVYTAGVQAPNAVNAAAIDALYDAAIDTLLTDDLPAREVNLVITARTSTEIRSHKKSHVLAASASGIGRMTINAPTLKFKAISDAIGDTDASNTTAGVGANRDERVIYTWPGCQNFVPEAINFKLNTADGKTTIDGILDETFDTFYASVLSLLAPERNPGQATDPIPLCLGPVKGYQRGVSGLAMSDFKILKAKGVSALRISRGGPIIQSGVTSSLVLTKISRRRMADFIEDSVAQTLANYEKLPITEDFKDTTTTEVFNFLNDLLSPENKKAQRITAFNVDGESGNSASLLAKGIYVIQGNVQTTPTADFIVFNAAIGDSVVVTTS